MTKFKNMEYKSYASEYDGYDKLQKVSGVLADAFNTAVEIVLNSATPETTTDTKIQNTVDVATALFQEISGKKENVFLGTKDMTHMMLTFMQIAPRLDKDITVKNFKTKVPEISNQLFDTAVRKNLFRDGTIGVL